MNETNEMNDERRMRDVRRPRDGLAHAPPEFLIFNL